MAEKKLSIRERILKSDDRLFEDVPVDAWGVTVRVNAMTAKRGSAYLQGAGKDVPYDERFARLVVFAATDPATGEYIFTEEDIPDLCKKSLSPVYKLAQIAMRLNAMGKWDPENLA